MSKFGENCDTMLKGVYKNIMLIKPPTKRLKMKPDRKFKETLMRVSKILTEQDKRESELRRPSRINQILKTVVR